MRIARDANGDIVSADEVERGKGVPPFYCVDFACSVPLVHVRSFQRRNRVSVNVADFRRSPGESHKELCSFNIDAHLLRIATTHRTNYFCKHPDGTYRLQLLVPKARRQLDADAGPTSGPRRTSPIPDKELLDYVNSAMDLLDLRATLTEDLDSPEKLWLMFGDQRLAWEDFLYESKDHYRCFEYVARTGGEIPVAILGTVKEVTTVWKDRDLAVMNLVRLPSWPAATPGVKESLEASIWSETTDAFDAYKPEPDKPDVMVLAFGYWHAATEENGAYVNHKLRLWPVVPSQICIADAERLGSPLQSRPQAPSNDNSQPPRKELGGLLKVATRWLRNFWE